MAKIRDAWFNNIQSSQRSKARLPSQCRSATNAFESSFQIAQLQDTDLRRTCPDRGGD